MLPGTNHFVTGNRQRSAGVDLDFAGAGGHGGQICDVHSLVLVDYKGDAFGNGLSKSLLLSGQEPDSLAAGGSSLDSGIQREVVLAVINFGSIHASSFAITIQVPVDIYCVIVGQGTVIGQGATFLYDQFGSLLHDQLLICRNDELGLLRNRQSLSILKDKSIAKPYCFPVHLTLAPLEHNAVPVPGVGIGDRVSVDHSLAGNSLATGRPISGKVPAVATGAAADSVRTFAADSGRHSPGVNDDGIVTNMPPLPMPAPL